jgi:methylated-DNA-[protein]-cysteine S-methyltransferase
MTKTCYIQTPLGDIGVSEDGGAITEVFFGRRPTGEDLSSPLLEKAVDQLREYFAGRRRDFDLPLAPQGTPFSQSVWAALLKIPYGETRSYGDIARAAGSPKAFRAVGMANNRNPIAIVIPCHRVIGSDGTLVGYGSGLDKKRWLLALEGAAQPR